MGVSIDTHKYNINDIVDWVSENQEKFGLTQESKSDILVKVKKLVEAYAEFDTHTGDFSLLWNEYHWESNAALNFQTDAERLFGFEDRSNEDGSYTFVGRFPYSFGDSNREALDDEEWEEIFGFVPDPVDEEE